MRELHWTESSEEHIAAHGVEPDEVEDVLYSRPRYLEQGREDTQLCWGLTMAGRYLLVVLGDAANGGLSVVTAREMTRNEKRAFREKGR